MERMAAIAADSLSRDFETTIVLFSAENLFYKTATPIISLDLPSKKGKIKKGFQLIERIYKFKKLRKNLNCDAVISFGTSANYVNTFSKFIGGKGLAICSYRGFATIGKNSLNSLVNALSDVIVCISQEMSTELGKLYPKYMHKIHTIHNCLDIDKIRSVAPKSNFVPSKPSFVSIGRLEPVKGHRHLINAFALLKKRLVNATLVLIGDGSKRMQLEKQVEDLGLKGSVLFLGQRDNPFEYIKQCDICIQNSITEGFMNVIIEAGECGLPVISSACKTGPKEILCGSLEKAPTNIDDLTIVENGILTPPFISDDSNEIHKEEILARAMFVLVSDQDLKNRLSINIKQRVNDFTKSQYKCNWICLLNKHINS